MLALASLVGCVSATVDLWLTSRVTTSDLEHQLYQISTPGSPGYGKFLTALELAELLGRSDEEVQKVTDWLTTKNLRYRVSGTKDRIEVESEGMSYSFLQCFAADYTNGYFAARLPPILSYTKQKNSKYHQISNISSLNRFCVSRTM